MENPSEVRARMDLTVENSVTAAWILGLPFPPVPFMGRQPSCQRAAFAPAPGADMAGGRRKGPGWLFRRSSASL